MSPWDNLGKQKRMHEILVLNGSSYVSPYLEMAAELNLDITENPRRFLENPDRFAMVVFTGGADVSPEYYGEKEHHSCFTQPKRDAEEFLVANRAREYGIPMAGICRGAQLLCVFAGGKLVQDVRGHGRYHYLLVNEEDGSTEKYLVSSTHHQMQYPWDLPHTEYELIGWMESPLSDHYTMNPTETFSVDEASKNLRLEPDIVWYPKIKALGAQYHPEYHKPGDQGWKLYQKLLRRFMVPAIEELRRKNSAQATC